MAHRRTVTRFCDDAGLRGDDQVDLAEFIVAARYLGTDATDEELMQTFLDMETGEITADSAKEKLKVLMASVQDRYGYEAGAGDEADIDHEVVQLPRMEEDAEWQETHLDMFIREAGDDSKLQIAKNLMLTTQLTAQQVAGITGVDAALLEEWDDDDFDSDDDYDESMTQTVTQAEESVASAGGQTISITADQFNKAIVLTPDDMMQLNNMLSGGAEVVAESAEDALVLLRKFKAACQLTPAGAKRTKTLRKLVSMTQLEIPDEKDASGGAGATTVPNLSSTQKSNVFPRKYRVVIHPGALIKAAAELSSAEVAKLPVGTVVVVAEIVDRRARLIEPVNGWCSVTSKDGRTILQKESTHSPEMAKAIHAARSRQTKILILKSITTLEDTTVQRILEKSDWNLRRAIEAFYIAKYKTAEYLKNQEEEVAQGGDDGALTELPAGLTVPGGAEGPGGRKGRKGWWGKWKTFIKAQDHS